MEQLRQIGEVLGSMKTLTAFHDDTTINRSQCSLLIDALTHAFNAVTEEIKETLIFSEKNTKWAALDNPLRELHRIFLLSELFVQQCTETRDPRAIAIFSLIRADDCTDLLFHDLLSCFSAVMESIEAAGEISGADPEETRRKKLIFSKRYDRDFLNPNLFRREFRRHSFVSGNIAAAREYDRRSILERLDNRLANVLKCSTVKLFPSCTLVAAKDYQVRRRLGNGSQYKEIHWMGENFAVRHFFGDIKPLTSEIVKLCSLSHPNVLSVTCAFSDEDRRECFLLMELMHGSLSSHVKELTGRRRRHPLTFPAAVDILLQIARGIEYLHQRKICHGNLSSSNVLVKKISHSLRVRVSGFGLASVKNPGGGEGIKCSPPEAHGGAATWTEKGDVYCFGVVCMEVLAGKSDGAGEDLGPLNGLVRKCLRSGPYERPDFSTVCRVLRWAKRWVLLKTSATPSVDCMEIDMVLRRRFPEWGDSPESDQIPFQMFAYRVAEREMERGNETGGGDDNAFEPACLPVCSEAGKKGQRRASLGSVVQKRAAPLPTWRVLGSSGRRKSCGHASDSEIG